MSGPNQPPSASPYGNGPPGHSPQEYGPPSVAYTSEAPGPRDGSTPMSPGQNVPRTPRPPYGEYGRADSYGPAPQEYGPDFVGWGPEDSAPPGFAVPEQGPGPYGFEPLRNGEGQPGVPPSPHGFGPPGFDRHVRSSTGLVIGLIGGGVVLVALLVTVVVAVLGGSARNYTVGTPSTAGGYVLDTTGQAITKSVLSRQQASVRATGVEIDTLSSGFYRPRSSPASYLPVGVVFVGGTGDMGDPDTFIRGRRPAAGATITTVDPGGDGKAACVTVGPTSTCMWATEHSFGTITPTTPKSPAEIAAQMRRMRPDLEHQK